MSGGHRRSRQARTGAAVALAAGLALIAACASEAPDRLETVKAEQRIEAALAKSYDVPVDRAECPTNIELKKGATFRCTVTISGQRVAVQVTQRTAKGDLEAEAQAAVIRPAGIGGDLKARLDGQFGRAFTVDCGDPAVRVLAPGSTFTCQAADATTRRQVTVKVTDLAGSVTYDVGQDPAAGSTTAPDDSSFTSRTTAPTTTPTTTSGTTPPATTPTTPTTPVPTPR